MPTLTPSGLLAGSNGTGLYAGGGGSGIERGSTPVTPLEDVILATSPLAYWKLDETSGTDATDATGNGRTGTYTGTVTLASVEGADGTSYPNFGGGYVQIADDDVFSVDEAPGLTLFALINTDTIASGRRFIISKGNTAVYEWEFHINSGNGGRLYSVVYLPSGSAQSIEYVDPAIIAGKWIAVATRFASAAKDADHDPFIDSATEATSVTGTTFTGTYANNNAPIRIGWRGDGPASQQFDGSIAHVAVWAGEQDLSTIFASAEDNGWFYSPGTELSFPTPDAAGQPTHPSLVDFGTAWNSYRYWLAFTPYTNADIETENPCIIASNDLTTWVEPGSITNPITAAPGSPAYHADTHLIYDDANSRLICYYSYYDGSTNKSIRYKTSTDGETWSSEGTLYTVAVASANEISGTVRKVGSTWYQWFVSNVGSPNPLRYRTSSDPLTGWSAASDCTVSGGVPSDRDFWHIDVFEDDEGTLRMFMTDCTLDTNGSADNRIYLGSSSNGTSWQIDSSPVLMPDRTDSWSSDRLYRATGIQDGDTIKTIYAAFGPTVNVAGCGYIEFPLSAWPDPPA